jgi:phage tail sheath protein FI
VGSVKQTLTPLLRTQWRDGALLEEEPFSAWQQVATRMTEDDITNGRLIVEVGVAPVRPTEFVVFRIFQKTQEAKS